MNVSSLKRYNQALKRKVAKMERKLATVERLDSQNMDLLARLSDLTLVLERKGFSPIQPTDPGKDAWHRRPEES